MAKRPSSLPLRYVFWFGCRLLILLSVLFGIIAFTRLRSQPDPSPLLASRRSRVFLTSYEGFPKIAFLFLARRDLPLDFLWDAFFQNADAGRFSIYVHSKPGFAFNEATSKSRFFYGRQLKNSVKVEWGESNMIEAERLLLAAALEESANQRFILLSDSCVPLYNFNYIYNYVMASPRSFVDSFLDAKQDRYNPKMSPVIPKNKWRKGSQWITLVRGHAEVVVDDEVVFPVFKKHCKRRPPVDATKGKKYIELQQQQHNCIPDEHYVPTLLSMCGLENELERRTLTYTSWNPSATNMEKKGWHPLTFDYKSASPRRINQIKEMEWESYEAESRSEQCKTNSTLSRCYLFARKFSHGAAVRLLKDGSVGPFDPVSVGWNHSKLILLTPYTT